jgi:hypothetical protein
MPHHAPMAGLVKPNCSAKGSGQCPVWAGSVIRPRMGNMRRSRSMGAPSLAGLRSGWTSIRSSQRSRRMRNCSMPIANQLSPFAGWAT